jgi:hypothetical protein
VARECSPADCRRVGSADLTQTGAGRAVDVVVQTVGHIGVRRPVVYMDQVSAVDAVLARCLGYKHGKANEIGDDLRRRECRVGITRAPRRNRFATLIGGG